MRFFRRRSVDLPADEDTARGADVPAAVVASVPEEQRGGPSEQLADGRFIIAGTDLVMVANEREILDSGLWHEVQYASWDADSRVFRLVWSQPERPAITGQTISDNPKALMERITDGVNNTIVATRRFVTSGGVPVAASVRRRVDGNLFSVVVAAGPISSEDEKKAYQLEASLREELGMD